MCKNIWNHKKKKLREAMREMESGESLNIKYPSKISLSSIRVTASALGTDMARKYSVAKTDKFITVKRES